MNTLVLQAASVKSGDITIHGVVKTTSQSPEGYTVLYFENGNSLVFTGPEGLMVIRET